MLALVLWAKTPLSHKMYMTSESLRPLFLSGSLVGGKLEVLRGWQNVLKFKESEPVVGEARGAKLAHASYKIQTFSVTYGGVFKLLCRCCLKDKIRIDLEHGR